MRQTLQKKFIRTAMVPITALLLGVLVILNLANWYQVDQQTDRMLQTVLESEGLPEPLFPPRQPAPFPGPAWQEVLPPEMQEDIREVARHRVLAMLGLSAVIVALCWLGMLALVTVLARHSIQPVAESIEKQKQFITNAGHELKTPLAIIQANTEALELHQGESKWTRNIRTQIARLSGLMENLLTLARMDEGAHLPPAQPVELSALARETGESFQETAALRGIRLDMEVAPDLVFQTDRGHMIQLFSVLLDNAVKYTEPGGKILVTLSKTGAGLCLEVKNSPAQAPEDISCLFDRFYRGDPARTQKTGGCGVGLSAAQAIVQAWKGTITARTEGEHTVVFTVVF